MLPPIIKTLFYFLKSLVILWKGSTDICSNTGELDNMIYMIPFIWNAQNMPIHRARMQISSRLGLREGIGEGEIGSDC